MAKFYVGIDYSISCPGVSIYNGDPVDFRFDRCRCFYYTDRKELVWNNITGTRSRDGDAHDEERWVYRAEWLLECIRLSGVHDANEVCCVFEAYSFNSRGSRTFQIAENTGLAKHYVWKAGYNVTTVSPSSLKKFATGNGAADKELMYKAFLKETSVDIKAVLQPKSSTVGNPVSDVVDSWYLLKWGVSNAL